MAQLSNTSFDAATFEVWGALLTGACLVDVPRDVRLSPPLLTATLRESGITTLFLTTALFNEVIRSDATAFGTLREVLFGGEAADPERVRECLTGGGSPSRLVHVYGPTEGTTFSSWFPVRTVEPDAVTVSRERSVKTRLAAPYACSIVSLISLG